MKWRRREFSRPEVYAPPRLEVIPPEDPWMDNAIVINDKPTTLRVIRKYAMDMSETDYRNPAEQGLAMTVVALVDEVSWLHAQLRDATQ